MQLLGTIKQGNVICISSYMGGGGGGEVTIWFSHYTIVMSDVFHSQDKSKNMFSRI